MILPHPAVILSPLNLEQLYEFILAAAIIMERWAIHAVQLHVPIGIHGQALITAEDLSAIMVMETA